LSSTIFYRVCLRFSCHSTASLNCATDFRSAALPGGNPDRGENCQSPNDICDLKHANFPRCNIVKGFTATFLSHQPSISVTLMVVFVTLGFEGKSLFAGIRWGSNGLEYLSPSCTPRGLTNPFSPQACRCFPQQESAVTEELSLRLDA